MTTRSQEVRSSAPATEAPPLPRGYGLPLAITATTISLLVAALGVYIWLVAADQATGDFVWLRYVTILFACLTPLIVWPGVVGIRTAMKSRQLFRQGDLRRGRKSWAESDDEVKLCLGYAVGYFSILLVIILLTVNNGAFRAVFVRWEYAKQTLWPVLQVMWLNIAIATAAMAITLVLGLVLAVGRKAPGRAGRPVRAVAIAYIDITRAVPAVIMIYILGFGLPLTHIPIVSSQSGVVYAIVGLALNYSGQAAETYRAGLDSIHQGQFSAARSLGLGGGQTLRYVILPQAIRRVIPVILTLYIAMQKDTSLVFVLGVIDGFAQSRLFSAEFFNLTPVLIVCVWFIILTIPQTRFADYLLDRSAMRSQDRR